MTSIFRNFTLQDLIILVAVAVSVCSGVAVAQYQIGDLQQKIGTYAGDHDTLIEIKRDVEWIRERLKREHP